MMHEALRILCYRYGGGDRKIVETGNYYVKEVVSCNNSLKVWIKIMFIHEKFYLSTIVALYPLLDELKAKTKGVHAAYALFRCYQHLGGQNPPENFCHGLESVSAVGHAEHTAFEFLEDRLQKIQSELAIN